MNDVKTDLDDAMRMLVALHEEHMGIHEQLDALGVPHVPKRDGQWRLALLTNRLEMAERNLVHERARREKATDAHADASAKLCAIGVMLASYGLPSEPKALAKSIESERKRLAEDQALLVECRRQRDAAVEERNEARKDVEYERKLRTMLEEPVGKAIELVVKHGKMFGIGRAGQSIDECVSDMLNKLAERDDAWHEATGAARPDDARAIIAGLRAKLSAAVGLASQCKKALHEFSEDEYVKRMRANGCINPEDAIRSWYRNMQANVAAGRTNAAFEQPDPNASDVEPLLREADRWEPGLGFLNGRTSFDVIRDLAAALRAEQKRVDFHQRAESEIADHNRVARSHLRAVIAWQWPAGTKPKPVREAEAFLAGIHPLAQDEAETNLRAEVQRLRGELEAEKARHDKMSREWAADAQQREVNLVRALKAEQVVEAEKAKRDAFERILEDIGATLDASHAPPGLMAERVEWLAKRQTSFKPGADVVETLTDTAVAHVRGLYPVGAGATREVIRDATSAVVVALAEMVPSEEEIRAEVMKRSHGYACESTIDTTCSAVRSLILSRLGMTTTNAPVEPVQGRPLDNIDALLADVDRRYPASDLPKDAKAEPHFWHSDRLAATLARELRRVMAGPWLIAHTSGEDAGFSLCAQEASARDLFGKISREKDVDGAYLCRVVETNGGAK